MAVDRMSPLDASFLHIEDDVSHMHIGSVGDLRGAAARLRRRSPRWSRASCPLCRATARWCGSCRCDLGRPVWVDDPHFNLEYHVRHTALARARRRGRAAPPRRPGHVATARPHEAAVGDLDRRGPRATAAGRWCRRRTTAWSTACRAPTCSPWCSTPSPSRRRRSPDDWRARAARRAALELAAEAVVDMVAQPLRAVAGASRSATRVPRQAHRAAARGRPRACGRWPGWSGRRRCRRSTVRSARTAAGPGPRTTRRRRQAGAQGASAARSTTWCSP